MSDFQLEIEQLKKKIALLEQKKLEVPTYSFSKIKMKELKQLVNIKKSFSHQDIFDNWFHFDYIISNDELLFLQNLIDINILLISDYHEEDLKINFIAPLISKVNFFLFENEIRNYYNEKLTYQNEKFIFNGETDFMIANGLVDSEKPYFFIQEFKKGFENTNPEPQLLAELISAVELNNQTTMKGAYIIGATWNFVILEKLVSNSYQYFVSRDFNCTNIEDLKGIYKNLFFIKDEILQMQKEI